MRIFVGLTFALALSVQAQVNSWTNTLGGKWEVGANWSLGVPPTNSQSFISITNATTKTVAIDGTTSGSFPGTMTITNLFMSATAPDVNTLQLTNAGSATPLHLLSSCNLGSNTVLIVSNSALRVDGPLGFTLNGNVTNLAGGTIVVTNDVTIGNVAFARGSFVTQGGFLDVSNSVVVGAAITSQGTLTVASGTNRIYRILNVGFGGTGAVWVTGGELRSVRAAGSGTQIGNLSDGQLTISNGVMIAASIQLGANGGNGTLTIAGGASDLSGDLLLQGPATSSSTFRMAGGLLTITNSAFILDSLGSAQATIAGGTALVTSIVLSRRGTLTMSGGVLDSMNTLNVGQAPTGTGAVWLLAGQVVITNKIFASEPVVLIGRLGLGRVTVSNATVTAHTVNLGVFSGSRGELTLAGGTFSATNLLIGISDCTATGIVAVTGGTLLVTNAAHSATLEISTGTLTLNAGTIIANQIIITNGCGHFARSGGSLFYDAAVLDAARDDDGDGLSNGYEQSNGLDPLDANGDADGDGVIDTAELLAGTNPTNAASFLGITAIAKESNNLRVTWMTGVGKTNALERASGAAGSFTNSFTVLTNIITTGTTTNVLDLGAATNVPALYYRVRLVQ